MRSQFQHLGPAIALAVGCVMLYGMREQLHVQPRAAMSTIALDVPGHEVVKDVQIAASEQRVAGMDQFLNRTFQRDTLDAGFNVYVGYYTYQVQGKTIHSPKNCLPGAGWEPLASAPRSVRVGDREVVVNRYLLANKGVQALVYYWYQGRGRIEHDEYKVKWNLLKDAALHGRTEEALVRIVIPIDPKQLAREKPEAVYAAADAQADALTRQLVPRVTAVLPLPPGT
jgi:EpsI family protein